MSQVFVLDTEHRPVDPVHPGAARRRLTTGRAAVWRRAPFTLILKRAVPPATTRPVPLRVKGDPGSRTTGGAVVHDTTGQVVWAAEITHRGQHVHAALVARRLVRRTRRQRHTRYRPARFDHRARPRPGGWRPPSLESRLANGTTWVARLRRLCPGGARSQELVRFDTPLMPNAEVRGVAYQQGELAGYEGREYLLEKWGRRGAYCGATGVPLEVEHIIPQSRPGGTDRVSNLTLACAPCKQAKGTRTAEEYGHPAVQVQAKARQPLQDAAAVNTTRWALLPPPGGHGAAGGDGHGRADQVESHGARAAQGALAGRGRRGGEHAGGPARGRRAAARHHGDRARAPADVSDGGLRLPAHPRQGRAAGAGLADGRPGAGGGARGRSPRDLRGAGGGARPRLLQPAHCHRDGHRSRRAPLSSAAAQRRLGVQRPVNERRGGASAPGLKAGVPAPQPRWIELLLGRGQQSQ
jgi:5-methylcytosine-specific restriction endonuclease McrA